jgi:hypothetical protein
MAAKRKAKRKAEIHPAVVAWHKWLASEEGKGAVEAFDFTPAGYRQYLENRLNNAFQSGWNAAVESK